MRPLGRGDLMVDKNGTIWRAHQPVGVWGVNGGEPANAAKLRQRIPVRSCARTPSRGQRCWLADGSCGTI